MPETGQPAPVWPTAGPCPAKTTADRSTARSRTSAARCNSPIDPLLRAGVALLKQGQLLSAERLIRQSIEAGADAAGWFHLGVVQHGLRRLEEAARSFNEAIALAADFAEARNARATVLVELGRSEEAETELRKAIGTSPQDSQLHHNLAVLLAGRGDREGALRQYDEALALDPAHYGARLNRATLRLAQRDAEGALADFSLLADTEGAQGRVRALLLLHRDEQALDEAAQLVQRDPHNRLSARLQGTALASLGRLGEAQAALTRSGQPETARSVYIERALERQRACDWRDRERLVDTVREALSDPQPGELSSQELLFHAIALPLDNRALKAVATRVAVRIRERAAGIRCEQPLSEAPGNRLRVGFISPDFREHPGARLMWPLFAHRDRERFEYFAYALNADDGSAIRAELAGSADLFIDASSWSDEDILRRIRLDRLHLLIDKTGYFEGARPQVVAARAAPVQASLKGFQGTLGQGVVDYRVSDAMTTPPETQEDWSEGLVLIPEPHWAYDAAQAIAPSGSRESHGLPASGVVFCAFHQALKISPEIFAIWMRLLRRAPGSVLWILDGGAITRANLVREAGNAGIDGERLVFAPRLELAAHLGRMQHADLLLDTLHYGAHTTAADALHVGLPVLTRRGITMASRLCATLVHGAGLPELVVDNLQDYESKALQLALNPARLAEAKARLASARATAPFFATRERVRAIERAFVAMVERQRAGLAPATLIVD